MAYTYYNSKPDVTPDQEITSGQVGALFSTLTSQERITGDEELSKMWIISDVDVTIYIGLSQPMPYTSTVFLSASDNDTEGDLTGSEIKYGALKVVSATASAVKVTANPDYTLSRAGDFIVVSGKGYEIDTVTDNGDGTLDIAATIDYAVVPNPGEFVTTAFQMTLVTATAKSFWREEKVAAGADYLGEYVTARILIAD